MRMYFLQFPIVLLHLGTYPRQMLMSERHFHVLQEFFNSKYQYFFILNHNVIRYRLLYSLCIAKRVVQPLNKNLRIDDPVTGCSMPHPPHELSIIFINRITSIGCCSLCKSCCAARFVGPNDCIAAAISLGIARTISWCCCLGCWRIQM